MAHPTTYDPVLDRRFLPHDPAHAPANPEHILRSPAPGRALVLVPEEGPPLTVRPGEQVPGARYGSRQEVFTVDTTEHRLQLALLLAGRDTPSAFRCELGVTCRIVNPAAVVAHGVRDMSEAWAGPVREHLERVSRTYTGSQPREAEQALNAALRDFAGDSAVRLHGARVELLTVAAPFTDSARPGAAGRGTSSGAAPGGPRRSRVRGARPGGDSPEGTTSPSTPPPPHDASHVVPGEVVGRAEATPPPPRFAPPPPPGTPPPPPHKPPASGPSHGTPAPPRPAHPPYAPPPGEPPTPTAPPTPPPAATPPPRKPRTSRVRGAKPADRKNPESDGGRVSGS